MAAGIGVVGMYFDFDLIVLAVFFFFFLILSLLLWRRPSATRLAQRAPVAKGRLGLRATSAKACAPPCTRAAEYGGGLGGGSAA